LRDDEDGEERVHAYEDAYRGRKVA